MCRDDRLDRPSGGRLRVAKRHSSVTHGGGMNTRRALQILIPIDLLVLAFAYLSAVRPEWVTAALDLLYRQE
jgi:hypothetical protein